MARQEEEGEKPMEQKAEMQDEKERQWRLHQTQKVRKLIKKKKTGKRGRQ